MRSSRKYLSVTEKSITLSTSFKMSGLGWRWIVGDWIHRYGDTRNLCAALYSVRKGIWLQGPPA